MRSVIEKKSCGFTPYNIESPQCFNREARYHRGSDCLEHARDDADSGWEGLYAKKAACMHRIPENVYACVPTTGGCQPAGHFCRGKV